MMDIPNNDSQSRYQLPRIFYWLVLAIVLGITVYSMIRANTSHSLSDTYQDSTVDITLHPGAVLYAGQVIEVDWNVWGTREVYLNEQGRIGVDTDFVPVDHCTRLSWRVIFLDDTQETYTVSIPFVGMSGAVWLGAVIIFGLMVYLIKRNHPATRSNQYARFALLLVLWLLLIAGYYLFPVSCDSSDIDAIQPLIQSLYGLLMLLTTVTFSISLWRPEQLDISRLWFVVGSAGLLLVAGSDILFVRRILTELFGEYPWFLLVVLLVTCLVSIATTYKNPGIAARMRLVLVLILVLLVMWMNQETFKVFRPPIQERPAIVYRI